MDEINIKLTTEEEVELFKWCWKHFDILNASRKVKSGQVVYHMDDQGDIKKPEFHLYNLGGIDKLFGKIL